MRKVCPQCNGRGKVLVNLGGIFIDAVCLDCNETGYIEVTENSCKEEKETANTDNQ